MEKEEAALWSAAIISCVWIIFEAYNFLGPLLLKKPSSSKRMFMPQGSRYTFAPQWGNIAFDTATDIIFFFWGLYGQPLLRLHHQCAGYYAGIAGFAHLSLRILVYDQDVPAGAAVSFPVPPQSVAAGNFRSEPHRGTAVHGE
ncbi:hypothetical protein MKQ70_10590 [Chitinophaga sedimenti]|uniref:hypothetical protein n=1 Tax=Chitinophaga sedimenti TaxID=2033606 RepID=UPI002003813E|nr:hypothetical protein [Chitinophaga sedimenti]MCK7555428.1 hypothetical protein [Chitinophaga sedimenti]